MNQTSPEFTAASETQENNDRESNGEKEAERERKSSVLRPVTFQTECALKREITKKPRVKNK